MNTNNQLLLGCVADDFTGASDAASFLVDHGIPVILYNGIPSNPESLQGCAAAIIALKIRSIPADEAVSDTRNAFKFFESYGAEQFYIKYCSTFDSTAKGNIGPVVDATLEDYQIPYTLLCPSLPVNRRQVRNGNLYVDGIPLHESPMKNHPLNPMWDSSIPKLMEPQGKYPCLVLNADDLSKPDKEIQSKIDAFSRNNLHFYVVPDYEDEAQGARIIQLFGRLRLLTGGSGLLAHWADRYKSTLGLKDARMIKSQVSGKGLILSGSCSKAVRAQVRYYKKSGGAALAIDVAKLFDGSLNIDTIWKYIQEHNEPLIYSAAADPGYTEVGIESNQAAHILEKTMSEVGRRACEAGYTRIVVAGGETSGAVTLALGFNSFLIGESIAPGVPIMIPSENRGIRLVLKSGNFGQEDFFQRALTKTREKSYNV